MDKNAKFRSKPSKSTCQAGYSLVETIIVLIILGILATVAMRGLSSSDEVARTARTRAALDQLAFAIAGNPELVSGGSRTDFGYVGDIGALPPDLSALVTNPGGYSTWNGPYISDQFKLSGTASALFKDGWGTAFTYSGTNLIQSTGGGTNISRSVANSVDHLLNNSLNLTVIDLDLHSPGSVYKDSILISLIVPNGAGATTSRLENPLQDGSVVIDSLPVGRHLLRVIYLPDSDTLTRMVSIEPGQTDHLEITFPSDLW